MPRVIKAYVRYVDAFNRGLGNVVMYLIFVMIGVLLFASVTRYVLNIPFIWIIELSQFLMAAYWILGGPYSMQLNTHVRMDVLYERWRPKTQGFWDSLTAICLIFYLLMLFRGGFASTAYSLEHGQRNYSAWAPLMWPIKAIMTVGFGLMILQAISIFFKDLAKFMGRDIA
ncbi:MAG: TRAP transporter small permease subunit [Steroidobacteraceae bacterium]|jgi:TRAP-type mannitol/chloroaromatic compound transport system permease small subunit|nr:TRAP transporter small permease subunit [Steroidobacteraceae bacterium]